MNGGAKAVPYVEAVGQGPAYWMVGILWVVLAAGEQTGDAYSLIWQLCPRGSGPGPHYHDQDEQFLVMDGEITYLANGEGLKAEPGSFVQIPRGTVHSFRVDSETASLLDSYTPAGFERTIVELGERARAVLAVLDVRARTTARGHPDLEEGVGPPVLSPATRKATGPAAGTRRGRTPAKPARPAPGQRSPHLPRPVPGADAQEREPEQPHDALRRRTYRLPPSPLAVRPQAPPEPVFPHLPRNLLTALSRQIQVRAA